MTWYWVWGYSVLVSVLVHPHSLGWGNPEVISPLQLLYSDSNPPPSPFPVYLQLFSIMEAKSKIYSLTIAPFPLEIHMAPLAIIQSLVAGFHLDAPGAHIHDQIEKSIQQLDSEEVSPGLPVRLRPLQAAMAEQQQAVGLGGAEVKRYGARLLRVPPGQCQVGRRCVEGDWLQSFHVLAAEYQVTMDTDLRVSLFSQP